ncbi:MAG: DUF2341 domain-containing protein [Candidatus Nanohalobium sp.]
MKGLKLILIAAAILLLAGFASAQLEGYWRFDNPQVSRGYSLEFDGSDDYITSDFLSNSNYTEFTVTLWFKKSVGNTAWETIVAADNWNQNRGWAIYENDNKIYFEGPNFGGVQTSVNYTDNKWHFLSARSNGTHIMLQIDDGPVITTTGSIQPSTKGIQIGARNNNDGAGTHDFYDGKIDQISFYNRTLTDAELQRIRKGFLPGQGLKFLQNFNEGPECDVTISNPCLSDDSSFSNPGTPFGFNDNNLATGSGWIKETPVNRPSVKDYSNTGDLAKFKSDFTGQLNNFDFNASSGWISGRSGEYALNFDGPSYVQINNVPDVGSSSFSFSFWFRGDFSNMSSNYPNVFNNFWGRGDSDAGFRFDSRSTNRYIQCFCYKNAYSEWTLVTASINQSAGTGRFYRDTELIGTISFNPGEYVPDPSPIYFGTDSYSGVLDDFRYYSRPLTAAEVKSLYNGESVTEGLVGRWNFESGDRKKAYDSSGFSADGILNSGALGPGSSRNISTEASVKNNFTVSAWADPSGTDWDNLLYSYRKSVSVQENSGRTLQNFQVNFTVDTASLIQEGKMDSDCSDMRFYSFNGSRLYHDIVSGCNTASTEVLVKIKELPANDKRRIWMYYGSASEGGETPEKAYYVYDLFGSGYDGTLTGDANYHQEEGFVELTKNLDGQFGALNYTNGTPEPGWKASWEYYIGNGTDADALWIYGWGSTIPGTEDADKNAVNWILNDHDDCIGVGYNSQCGGFGSWSENPRTEQWETASAYGYRNGSTLHFKLRTLGNQTSGNWTYSGFPMGSMFGFGARTGGANNYHWVKNIKIRKYVKPSPSVTIGEEQERPEIVHSQNISLAVSEKGAAFEVGEEFVRIEKPVERWQKVSAVYNSSALTLYLGDIVNTKNYSYNLPPQNFTLARNNNGAIDELRIYNQSLSRTKVRDLGFQ